jgi:hypothetical protein
VDSQERCVLIRLSEKFQQCAVLETACYDLCEVCSAIIEPGLTFLIFVVFSLLSSYKRVFPNPFIFKNDPPSWKLTKAAALPSDGVEYCFVYVVFSSSRLESGKRFRTIYCSYSRR